MEFVGEVVLSVALEYLLETLTSSDFFKFPRKNEVDKELNKWKSMLMQIRAVLNDAEEKQYTEKAVKLWLADLGHLAYDAEDILEEFHTTEALQSKLTSAESQANTRTMHKLLPSCCAVLKPSGLRRNRNILSRLQDITARFDEIVKTKTDLDLASNNGGRPHRVARVPTTSQVNEPKIYGRAKEKEDILELLKHDETSVFPYSVIPIVGMGGLGKTTLAQLVYNDVKSSFNCTAWVCVSDYFDIFKITKEILSELRSREGETLNALQETLNALQETLKKELQGKKFLIVLDDVWNENYHQWTILRSPFAAGVRGSKIIVTTRSAEVGRIMGSVPVLALKELSDDDCLSLLAQHALNANNFDEHLHLKEIGQEIVRKCDGLPLAVKTLGGILRGEQTIEVWEGIRDSEMWDLPEQRSDLRPALILSYRHLPSHLKKCFEFCAIFPKDYQFDDNELILLWMAEGLLKTKEKRHLDDVGREYFKDLLSRSFFQRSSANDERYVMHDLINDLAKFVCRGICFHLDDKSNDAEAHANIRHSSFAACVYDKWQRFEVFKKMTKLRTFLVLPKCFYYYSGCYLASMVLDKLVVKLNYLRSLSLADYNLVELPDSIGSLKLLRFLNVSGNPITKLPQSLSELFNLQTLLLFRCRQLVELPMDIGNLRKLQYLDIRDTDSLQMMPLQIIELTNLRRLSKFIVGEGRGLGVGDLMKFPHLQGELQVTGLSNVANIRDAKLANLKEKQGLCELALQWNDRFDDSRDGVDELQVLSELRPHPFLKKLSISSYGAAEFPSWLGNPSFNEMVTLELDNCQNIKPILSLGELSALEYLSIRRMHGVKEVALKKFPALCTLVIEDMPGWKEWSHGSDEEFPKLSTLELKKCPKLVGNLPRSLPCLETLDVTECQEAVLRSVAYLPSLKTLIITAISGLASFDGTLVVQARAALEELSVGRCDELIYLWQDGTGLNNLANLRVLGIIYCKQLGSLVEGEEGLLPNGLHNLTSLTNLKIWGCEELRSFPQGKLPTTLKSLTIGRCEKLASLPDGIMMYNNCGGDSSHFPSGHRFPTSLEHIVTSLEHIVMCALKPTGQLYFPTSLKTLEICDSKMNSLSPSLHLDSLSNLVELTISRCYELESFPQEGLPLPNLIKLQIKECRKLSRLPNSMDNLTSLQDLKVCLCSSLVSLTTSGLPPNLTDLEISFCGNLAQRMSEWGLNALNSLTTLNITSNEESFPDDSNGRPVLPTSLTRLDIICDENLKSISKGIQHLTSLENLWIFMCPNLKSISRGIQHLTSLEELSIFYCSKLQSLPKEGLPATLRSLLIHGCPLLKDSFKKVKVAHIPRVDIDFDD